MLELIQAEELIKATGWIVIFITNARTNPG